MVETTELKPIRENERWRKREERKEKWCSNDGEYMNVTGLDRTIVSAQA